MSTRLVTRPLVLLFLCFAVPLEAQDASKILDQYVKASGGAHALAKIQTLTLEGTVAAQNGGKPGAYTFAVKMPNRYYSELVIGDQTLIEAFNGKSAWHQNAGAEISTLVGPEGVQLEAAARYYNSHLLNPKKNKLVITYVGTAPVRGKDASQLQISTPSGVQWQVFFDVQSHLIVKESAQVGGVNQEILYDGYRAENGVQLPHKIELHRGAEIYSIAVTRAAVNEPVGERVFDFPRKSQVQLPDLKALFRQIDANQQALDKIKENYAGNKVEEETEYEGNGKPKKPQVRESTFFYLDGTEVSTLVKIDGQPLSAEAQKKETARVLKQIDELQKNASKKESPDEKSKQARKEDEEEDVSIDAFLRACQFVNPRRERFRGQDVLVFDFEPNPEFKAHTLVEKVIQKLGGVIWIDEKALDVVRLDAFFVNNVKFAGGLLADLQKGTRVVLEQTFVNNEVWLPTYEEVHLDVRVLLLKGIKVDGTTRYSDYKKFSVETLSAIGKPKAAADPAAANSPEKPQ
ncbi:MAG TPA: hypothetical protein VN902_03630 [Candidatus Acidoferrales bacterium]|nr:hypothetical protein [Candidatus Acidoferrales bacterium]